MPYCKNCGKKIYWIKNEKGGWQAMDSKDKIHLLSCKPDPKYIEKYRRNCEKKG